MAYENGYEVVDYIGGCIEKYREDPLIFSKAAQLMTIFMARSDWPHCYEEMDKAMAAILGESLTNLISFTQRYLHDERMIWPDDLPKGFEHELEAFHLATNHLVEQLYIGRAKPMKLFSIARSRSYEGQIVRFIRGDGAFLDLELDDYDIKTIIRTLQQFYERQDG